MEQTHWDYIIVGGGSAGCVLALRLSENPAINVLLLEAGPYVDDNDVDTPPAWPGLAGGAFDWGYSSAPQTGLKGRILPQPRGKGLGGSSLINAMGHQRGARQAYDKWAEITGDDGWNFDSLLAYFKRSETASGGGNQYRGGDGPLSVLELTGLSSLTPLAHSIADAGVEAGFPLNPDWNGAREDGTVFGQLTIKNGKRHNAAEAFLSPARSRKNLTLIQSAAVQKLQIEKDMCASVVVKIGGAVQSFTAARETILCAGAFDSPRLLMMSGIGDAVQLESISLDVKLDLPGVGQNLQDHPLAPGLLFRSDRPIPMSLYNHCESLIVAESSQSPGWADIMIMGLSVPFISPELGPPPANCFAFVPSLLYPRSRGSLTLRSADPSVPLEIDPGYLKDPKDVEALVDCYEIAREVASMPALQEWIVEEVFPGPKMTLRKALGDYIRQVASPYFHPVSTCMMGKSNNSKAVLDSACRVRGIEKLRVVDASAIPAIPQAMTHAAVLALAERAADLILAEA